MQKKSCALDPRHKADGNRGNKACKFPACANWKDCGKKEYKKELKQIEKEIKALIKEIKEIELEINQAQNFNVRLSCYFIHVIKERLRKTDRKNM